MSEDIRSLDTAGAFEAATFGGAAALGRDDIGALAPGMAADIVLVDINHPLMQPMRDPLRSFVFHAADRAVRTVLVDGEVVLEDGEPVHLDPGPRWRVAEAQARMIRDAPKIDYAQRPGDKISPIIARDVLRRLNPNISSLAKPGRWRGNPRRRGHQATASVAAYDPSAPV